MRGGIASFLNKRALGFFSRRVLPARPYRPEIVAALFEDIREQAPDHVAITGDLTNVSLEQEFEAAAQLLRRLGEPDWISLVPGNHDAYVHVEQERSWGLWSEYIASDANEHSAEGPADDPRGGYPTVRVRGPVAIVGLCSAIPTPLHLATGELGASQLERLEKQLAALGARNLARVVLVHHPPTDHDLKPRRRLIDAAALRDVLSRVGAELVLHGHKHRTSLHEIEGPDGPIPSIGTRSSSHAPDEEKKRAQYHIYEIDPGQPRRPGISLRTRGWDPVGKRFVEEERHHLS